MISLTALEKLGLTIVALMRSKQLDAFKCEHCTAEMQESRDCNGNGLLEESVFYHSKTGEFFSCPVLFVSSAIGEFISEFDYLEKYPNTAVNFKDVNPRFWESVKFFEGLMFELNSKDKEKVNNSDSSMKKMNALFGGDNVSK